MLVASFNSISIAISLLLSLFRKEKGNLAAKAVFDDNVSVGGIFYNTIRSVAVSSR
jgi:hypothetical protein